MLTERWTFGCTRLTICKMVVGLYGGDQDSQPIEHIYTQAPRWFEEFINFKNDYKVSAGKEKD